MSKLFPLLTLGVVYYCEGDMKGASQLLKESLFLFVTDNYRNKRWGAESLAMLAGVVRAQGQPVRAATLFGAAQALYDAIGGAGVMPMHRDLYEPAVADTRSELDEQQFAAAWAEGRAMTLERAVEYALGSDA